MTIYSRFKSFYIYILLFVLGIIFLVRDYVFALNSTLDFKWLQYTFSIFSDQFLWVPILPALFYLFEKSSLFNKKITISTLKLFPILILIAFIHRYIAVVGAKYIEYKLDIINENYYERIQAYYTALISGGTLNDIIFCIIIILILSFIRYYEQFKDEQIKNLSITKQLNDAQLDTLKMQIQPHFLFNSLNTVSAIMEENVESAQAIVSKLSSFLRYSLDYQSQKFVTLAEEINFTKTYLDIELERFSDRLTVNISIDEETEHFLIPAFLLQPFIENSFKHGVNKFSSVTEIYIKSERSDGKLHLTVGNNGIGDDKKVIFGIGLSNIKNRLETIYNGDYSLNVSSESGFINKIILPISEEI